VPPSKAALHRNWDTTSSLLEGLATGESDLTRQDFKDIRKAALARLKARKKKGRNAASA
jgi:hypothetical protein